MGPIKKKPKALSKSKRCMLVSSLVLVLLGCAALYWAMQNQDWTQDELTQRKIFFIAFLLLMASLLLSYWALSGDLEDDAEKVQWKRLTTVKHGQYNSFKQGTLTINEQRQISKDAQQKYIDMLEPELQGFRKPSKSKRTSSSRNSRGTRNTNTPIITDNEDRTPAGTSCGNHTSESSETNNQDNSQLKSKSLIVELMPLLPLQLCERDFDSLNLPPQALSFDPNQLINVPRNNLIFLPYHSQSELPRTFNSVHKNSEAG